MLRPKFTCFTFTCASLTRQERITWSTTDRFHDSHASLTHCVAFVVTRRCLPLPHSPTTTFLSSALPDTHSPTFIFLKASPGHSTTSPTSTHSSYIHISTQSKTSAVMSEKVAAKGWTDTEKVMNITNSDIMNSHLHSTDRSLPPNHLQERCHPVAGAHSPGRSHPEGLPGHGRQREAED
jgi:hypothetical protein